MGDFPPGLWARARLLAAGLLVALPGCAEVPPCDVVPGHESHAIGNAGCMVIRDERMLVVRDRHSGRLGFPGGARDPREPAQCTAARETWEETGYRVRVGPEVARFGRDFFLYRCFAGDRAVLNDPPQVPFSSRIEIESVHWLRPADIDSQDWRFPEQFPYVLRLFEQEIRP